MIPGLALLQTEARSILRDRAFWLGFPISVGIGLLGPVSMILESRFSRDAPASAPEQAWPCDPSGLPPIAAEGEPPAWFDWPEAFVPEETASAFVRFGMQGDGSADIEVEAQVITTAARPVKACIDELVVAERRARLDILGVTEDPKTAVRVTGSSPTGTKEKPSTRFVGVFVGAALILLLSIFSDLGPKSRLTGWLESCLVLPLRRSTIVGAWWLLGILGLSAGLGLVLLGDAIGYAIWGLDTGTMPWSLAPVLILVASATGVRAFADVPDLRTSQLQILVVMLLLTSLFGLALLGESRVPGLGAMVPLGGLVLAMTGRTGHLAIASTTALLTAGWLLWDTVRVLDRCIGQGGAQGRTAARRARGDYLPEMLLLAAIALGGIVGFGTPPRAGEDPALRLTVCLVLFMAIPALAVSVPFRLDRRALLSLWTPPLRGVLLLPAIALGFWALGILLGEAGIRLFPSPSQLWTLSEAFGRFDTPAGLLAISVGPGICEELLFRGAILGLLLRRQASWTSRSERVVGTLVAILVQAAIFALFHGYGVRLPATFALGCLLGLLVVRTGSILPAMIAHATSNLLAFGLAGQPHDLDSGNPATWALASLGVMAVWLSGKRQRTTPAPTTS